jgi:nucleoside 2-deoxyribosyltransferase
MVDPQLNADEVHEFDEGSWVYLSSQDAMHGRRRDLQRGLIDTCAENGWSAVSWSPSQHSHSPTDSSRFFDGMSHAVEHADVVVVLLNGSSTMTDAELVFAYRHRRPVIALRIEDEESIRSEVREMLSGYDRALIVGCSDTEGCLVALRKALADPSFAAIIREAASESSSYA